MIKKEISSKSFFFQKNQTKTSDGVIGYIPGGSGGSTSCMGFNHTLNHSNHPGYNQSHHTLLIWGTSLVDGGGLRTFFCDPMHTLLSSGYTLSGIYIVDLRLGYSD